MTVDIAGIAVGVAKGVAVGPGVDVGVGAAVGEIFAVAVIDVSFEFGSEVVHCTISKTAISNAVVVSVRPNLDLGRTIEADSEISSVPLFSFRCLELCMMRTRITSSLVAWLTASVSNMSQYKPQLTPVIHRCGRSFS